MHTLFHSLVNSPLVQRLIALALVATPARTSAQINLQPPDVKFTSFGQVFTSGFNIVIMVSGIIFVLMLLFGGVLYLLAAGNEDNSKKARQLMLDAVIGLVIVATAWAIGSYILQLLGITISF